MARTRREWGTLQRRANGRYYLQYTDHLGVRRMRLAGATLKDAEAFLRATRRQVEAARRGQAVKPLTLDQFWNGAYFDVLASRLKESGLRTATVHVNRLLDWLFAQRSNPYLRDVDRADAEAFVAALVAEGLQPSYVRRMVNTIRRLWGDAMVRGLAFENPWAKLQIAPPRPTEVPWISPAQLTQLYAAITPAARPHLVFVGETGLRIGEAQALRWKDVDLAAAPRVVVRDGKTAASRRTVPLTPRAAAVLAQLLEDAGDAGEFDVVLPPYSQQNLRMALRRACKRVKCERLKVHSLRQDRKSVV